jgi:hypothetical protein
MVRAGLDDAQHEELVRLRDAGEISSEVTQSARARA